MREVDLLVSLLGTTDSRLGQRSVPKDIFSLFRSCLHQQQAAIEQEKKLSLSLIS
jgi:hypothetical protein